MVSGMLVCLLDYKPLDKQFVFSVVDWQVGGFVVCLFICLIVYLFYMFIYVVNA